MHQEVNLDEVRAIGLRQIAWNCGSVAVSEIIRQYRNVSGITVTEGQVRRVLADHSEYLTGGG